jgi:hypothetical protein
MTKKELIECLNGLPDEALVSIRVDLGSGLVVTADSKTSDIFVRVHEPVKSMDGSWWSDEWEIQIEAKGNRYYRTKKKRQ